jgi:hypothetical protein
MNQEKWSIVNYKRAKVNLEASPRKEGNDSQEAEAKEHEAQKPEALTFPPPSRSIIENSSLSQLIQENTVCRKCRLVGHLSLKFPSIGVTTIPRLVCGMCRTTYTASAQETGLERALNGSAKVTDYAANILYVVGFLTSGDGGTEAQKVLALLSAHSMEKNTFNKAERAVTL